MKGGEGVPDFEEIYRAYFADVYRYALALSGNPNMAEEVTQETFVRALTAIDSFRGECQLRVWLCRIARNQYLSLCRRRKRSAEAPGEVESGGVEEGFADRETARLLHALPEPYKGRYFPCGPLGSCPSGRSGSYLEKQRAGPG